MRLPEAAHMKNRKSIGRRLAACGDFAGVFSLVRETVKDELGMDRAGLILALQPLPENLGAFHTVGSNFIVINKTLLGRVRAGNGRETINSYIYYVLLHEYLHSLGFLDEEEVLGLSSRICSAALGEGHPASMIARHGIGSVVPAGIRPYEESDGDMEIVLNFDPESTSYIG